MLEAFAIFKGIFFLPWFQAKWVIFISVVWNDIKQQLSCCSQSISQGDNLMGCGPLLQKFHWCQEHHKKWNPNSGENGNKSSGENISAKKALHTTLSIIYQHKLFSTREKETCGSQIFMLNFHCRTWYFYTLFPLIIVRSTR